MNANTWRAVRQSQPWIYWLWLTSSLVVLLLASIMSVGDDRDVLLPGWGALPETCTLHTQLGIDCPGCGLTRSFIHLAHGRIAAAWSLNPVGLLIFVFVVSQVPLSLCLIYARRFQSCSMRKGGDGASNSQHQSNPKSGAIDISEPPLGGREPASRKPHHWWLGRWFYWNQWLLVGLMVALLLQWFTRLILGGLFG